MIVVYVLIALIGAAVAVFALQNLDPVTVRFLGWRIEGIPLALVILLSLMVGAFSASLVGLVQHLRLRSRIRQLERSLAQAPVLPAPDTDSRAPR
jgi:putative membrane protein